MRASVLRQCQMLGVSASGCHAWRGRKACRRQRDDLVLLAHVRASFARSRQTYGSLRIRAEGLAVGRQRIARMMQDNGLVALPKARFQKTTDSTHTQPVAPNLLDQDFTADGPSQKWGVDVTHVWTTESWLYLALVLDLFSRRIVGWAVSGRITKELAITALNRAVVLRNPPPGVVHHSDRDSQYCSDAYQKALKDHGFLVSMRGLGNCYDNAMVETVFKSLKSDLGWRTVVLSRRQAEAAIGHYIDGFYKSRQAAFGAGLSKPLRL